MSRSDAHDRERGAPAADTVEEALTEALAHARTAAAEAVLAARALLDATCIALYGEPAALPRREATESSATRLAFAGFANALDQLAMQLRTGEETATEELVASLLEALDHEILRWEERSRSDQEARAVLRAFLGLRELLWEFGMRRGDARGGPRRAEGRAPARRDEADEPTSPEGEEELGDEDLDSRPRRGRRGRRRVQRIEVRG